MSDFLEFMQVELLVTGFIHAFENKHNNRIFITSLVTKLILSFYPVLPKWEIYDSTNYKLSKNGKIITSINSFPGGLMTGSCFEYLIYPQCAAKNGYNKNIHYISIQNEHSCGCSHHFGITTKRDKNDLASVSHRFCMDDNDKDKKNGLYQYLCTKSPDKSVIITIKLDCINWVVTWFINNIETDNNKIEPNQCYYFVLKSCARDHTPMKIVQTDIMCLNTFNDILNNDKYRQMSLFLLTSNNNEFIKYFRKLIATKETCQRIWKQCAGYWGNINSQKFMKNFWEKPVNLFKMKQIGNESWKCVKCQNLNEKVMKCASCCTAYSEILKLENKEMKQEYMHLTVWIITMYGEKKKDGLPVFILKEDNFKGKIVQYVEKYVEVKGLNI
eukprot:100537_1